MPDFLVPGVMLNSILPFPGANFRALDSKFIKDLARRAGIADIDLLKERRGKQVRQIMPFATALPYVNELTELTSSSKSNGSEAKLILPLSILATSKTSLMSDSRKRDDKAILFRQLAEPFGVAHVHARNGRHADDRVHRRSDVVRHPGKELAFGMVGLFGGNVAPYAT